MSTVSASGERVAGRSVVRARPKKYELVRQAILREYATASSGTPLPPENDLCQAYGVSRITVRRAVADLVEDGFLHRQQGRGTFVAAQAELDPAPHADDVDFRGFHAQMTAQGFRVTSEVLAQGIFSAPDAVAAQLGIARGASVIRIDRLRYVDGRRDHLTRSWFDSSRYMDLLLQDFADQSLQTYLTEQHGFIPSTGRVETAVHLLEGDEAALLGIPPGSNRLETLFTFFDASRAPQVTGRTVYADSHASASFTVIGRQPS